MKTETLYSEKSCGTHGTFEMNITVGATVLPELDQDAIRTAAYEAAALIRREVMAAIIQQSPEAHERAHIERAQLLACFDAPIFVEEIPNGYCSDWCCRHLPWFVVTTKVGRFKIGWRKSFIQIDWSETVGTKSSDELFQAEDVTKDKRMIHAWSVENARCTEIDCEDGYYHDCGEDCCCCAYPEPNRACDECAGHGVLVWCANCGWEPLLKSYMNGKDQRELRSSDLRS